jgi:hypothetical protein
MVKFIFKLPNVNMREIDLQYKFTCSSNLNKTLVPVHATKIGDLDVAIERIDAVQFSDELQTSYNGRLSTIQLNPTSNMVLHCFWCRHPIFSKSIGCPLNLQPNTVTKQYTSHINGNDYCIREQLREEAPTQVYDVDGSFCSFECCYAFIRDHKTDPMYSQSETLLRKIYYQHAQSVDLQCAPHWRLLREYGGNMSIEEFRASVHTITYTLEQVLWNPVYLLFRETYHL